MRYDYTLTTDDIICVRRLFTETISNNIDPKVKNANITFNQDENGLFNVRCEFETIDETQGVR